MSNAMKYIRDLEAAGFQRNQAEAQVQMVLDAIEGDLVTKSDFAIFHERLDNRFGRIDGRFSQIESRFDQIESRFDQIDNRFTQVDNRFNHFEKQIQSQIKESEFRLTTRLGFIVISAGSIAVAVLTWLIKI